MSLPSALILEPAPEKVGDLIFRGQCSKQNQMHTHKRQNNNINKKTHYLKFLKMSYVVSPPSALVPGT